MRIFPTCIVSTDLPLSIRCLFKSKNSGPTSISPSFTWTLIDPFMRAYLISIGFIDVNINAISFALDLNLGPNFE